MSATMNAVAAKRVGPPNAVLEPGAMVDHFRIVRVIGRGAGGVVYVARDTTLGRKVALKVVKPDALANDRAGEAFLREATITASFNHPHIVTIYAVGEHAGAPYLALEYLDGQTLFERAAAQRPSSTETVRYGLAIAQALAEAHAHGVLHRDLKPENVYIARDGRLRVLDFGVARRMEAVTDATSLVPLSLAGTPAYVAPELWLGDEPSSASDVWSLGVTLFELLANRPPFEGDDLGALSQRITEEDPCFDGAAVSPPLRDLVARCLDKSPELRPAAAEVGDELRALLDPRRELSSGELPPFRGLLPFEEEHAHLYFGRDAEIAGCVERLRTTAVMAIVGPSGAGKSSFVRAGVIPRLREQGTWHVILLRPGAHPLARLAARLRVAEPHADEHVLAEEDLATTPSLLALSLQRQAEASGARLLLVVDQLEEVYSLVDDPAERRAFLEAIAAAADDPEGPVRVLVTLRDDFLGRVAESPASRDALSQVVILHNPEPEQLVEMLTGPLDRVGYGFEDGQLPEEIAAAVAGEPACLPLLSFACAKLWERADVDERTLTREAYEAIGGVEGALAKHAEELLDALTHDERDIARRLALRLVTPARTRRVIARDELLEGLPQSASRVSDKLVGGRVVVVRKGREGPSELELAHESLITRWARLARWLDESRDEVAFLAEIGEVAQGWARRGSHHEEAWQGKMLQEALARAERCESLPGKVDAFLRAGVRRRDRTVRTRRALVATAVALLTVAIVVLAAKEREAQQERQRAEQERGVAEQQRAVAQREGADAALARGDLAEARAKLRGSFEAQDSPQARALLRELSQSPLHWHKELSSFAYGMSLSPDGETVAVAAGPSVHVVHDQTLAVRVLRGAEGAVLTVAHSPDGALIAAGDARGHVMVWQDGHGSPKLLAGHPKSVRKVAFSPGGDTLATASEDGTVRLWSVSSPKADPVVLRGHVGAVITLNFSPDGRTLASAGNDKTVRLWDLATKRERRILRGHDGQVHGVAYSSDGAWLASGSFDGTIVMWDAASGDQRRVVTASTGVTSVAFSKDGRYLAGGTRDGMLHVVDRTSPRRWQFVAHTAAVFDVAFARDGLRLYSSSNDRTLRAWNLEISARNRDIGAHTAPIVGLAFSPGGETIATGSDDRSVKLWDAKTGVTLATLRGHQEWVRGVDFSPDGKLLATGSRDRTVRLWDVATRKEKAVLRNHRIGVHHVRFSVDGERLVSVANGSEVYFWDVASETGSNIAHGPRSRRSVAAMTADGETLAIGRTDGGIDLASARDGSHRRLLDGHAGKVNGLAFVPSGGLFSAGWDRTVRQWDPATGSHRVIRSGTWRFNGLAASSDGAHVAAAGADRLGYLLDVASDSWRLLKGHRDEVNDVRFSPDGTRLATVSDDATLRLWDVASGRRVWRTVALLRSPMRVYGHRGWSLGPRPPGAWAQVVETAASASQSAGGGLLCVVRGGRLEIWNTTRDEQVHVVDVDASRVHATEQGCVAATERGAVLYDPSSGLRRLAENALAIGVTEDRLLLALEGEVRAFDHAGEPGATHPVDAAVSALGQIEGRLVLGFVGGGVEIRGAAPQPAISLELTPSSPAQLIQPGPPGTLFVGYANGAYGLWSQKDGSRLLHGRLHGAILDVALHESTLLVASDLGDHVTLDLSAFYRDYCEQLRVIWADVGTVWKDGAIVLQPPPSNHRCAKR
jgi:WD40 repeat protein